MHKNKRKKSGLISFYPRKLLFFGVFLLLVFLIGPYIKTNYLDADVPINELEEIFSSKEYKVSVSEKGKVTLNGKQINKRINYLPDSDELRLVMLDNSGKYIDNFSATLSLPSNIAKEVKTDLLAIHGVGDTRIRVSSNNSITYEAYSVSPAATLTIVAKMPKGTIKPSVLDRAISYLSSAKSSYWIAFAIALPVITFLLMTAFLFYISRRQRVDSPKNEIENPPMAIPPAVVGVLFNQRVSSREIAATLIDLALRGDLVIFDQDRGFAFGKGRFDQRLLEFEKILLSKIFKSNSTISDKMEIEERLNNHLYSRKVSMAATGIYALATMLGYFKVNPQKSHFKYRMIGLGFFMLGFLGFCVNMFLIKDPPYLAFLWAGMMISSLVIVVLASRLPTRTAIGQEVMSNWLAFKKYLANPKKIPFSENNQDTFQRYLPYAIVMNCETAWAKRFSEHNFVLPDWFLTEKNGLGLEDFCLSLFPIVSYVSRSLVALNEPGFD